MVVFGLFGTGLFLASNFCEVGIVGEKFLVGGEYGVYDEEWFL